MGGKNKKKKQEVRDQEDESIPPADVIDSLLDSQINSKQSPSNTNEVKIEESQEENGQKVQSHIQKKVYQQAIQSKDDLLKTQGEKREALVDVLQRQQEPCMEQRLRVAYQKQEIQVLGEIGGNSENGEQILEEKSEEKNELKEIQSIEIQLSQENLQIISTLQNEQEHGQDGLIEEIVKERSLIEQLQQIDVVNGQVQAKQSRIQQKKEENQVNQEYKMAQKEAQQKQQSSAKIQKKNQKSEEKFQATNNDIIRIDLHPLQNSPNQRQKQFGDERSIFTLVNSQEICLSQSQEIHVEESVIIERNTQISDFRPIQNQASLKYSNLNFSSHPYHQVIQNLNNHRVKQSNLTDQVLVDHKIDFAHHNQTENTESKIGQISQIKQIPQKDQLPNSNNEIESQKVDIKQQEIKDKAQNIQMNEMREVKHNQENPQPKQYQLQKVQQPLLVKKETKQILPPPPPVAQNRKPKPWEMMKSKLMKDSAKPHNLPKQSYSLPQSPKKQLKNESIEQVSEGKPNLVQLAPQIQPIPPILNEKVQIKRSIISEDINNAKVEQEPSQEQNKEVQVDRKLNYFPKLKQATSLYYKVNQQGEQELVAPVQSQFPNPSNQQRKEQIKGPEDSQQLQNQFIILPKHVGPVQNQVQPQSEGLARLIRSQRSLSEEKLRIQQQQRSRWQVEVEKERKIKQLQNQKREHEEFESSANSFWTKMLISGASGLIAGGASYLIGRNKALGTITGMAVVLATYFLQH